MKPLEPINQGGDFLTVVAQVPLTIEVMVGSVRRTVEFFQ